MGTCRINCTANPNSNPEHPALAALGELALQQSAARVEEAYEALLEGRPIRSWSAPELVELEAIANGEQVLNPAACALARRVALRSLESIA